MQDIGADVSQVSRRWLEEAAPQEARTPDMDGMDLDQYQHSLTQYVPILVLAHTEPTGIGTRSTVHIGTH